MDRYGADKRTLYRVLQDFKVTMRLNNVSCYLRGLQIYIGRALASGLSPGTIDTYVRYLTKFILPDLTPLQKLEWRTVVNAVGMMHADCDTRSATAIDSVALRKITRLFPNIDPSMISAVEIMANFGMRLKDISKLRAKQVKLTATHRQVEIRVSKNRRKRGQRFDLTVPRGMWSGAMRVTKDVLERSSPDDRPWRLITVSAVNAFLRSRLKRPKPLTSYSVRKYYINRAWEYAQFDAGEVTRFTAHLNPRIVQAHYPYSGDRSVEC